MFKSRIMLIVLCLALLTPGVVPAQEDTPFTVQTAEEFQAPLVALYEAYMMEGELSFVDADADLVVGDNVASPDAAMLPEALLDLQTDNAEAAAFVDFIVSAEGQQVLIDLGLLPNRVIVTDQAGNEVILPQPVERVVSPYGPLAYFFYAVGAEGRLIAVNPLGARNLDGPAGQAMTRIDPRFPDIHETTINTGELNVEQLAVWEADLVVTSPRSPYIDAVRELGVPVVLFDAETPETLVEAMRLFGAMFGPNAAFRAEQWIKYFEPLTEQLQAATGELEAQKSVLFTGTEPLRVASGEMFQTSIVEFAGGTSVSDELTGFWNDVNLEQIVLWNPEVIIVPSYRGASVEAITEAEEWEVVPAAAEGRVYQMPQLAAPLDAPGPDAVVGIIWMAKTLYGDAIELDCGAEVEYYYATFYDYDLSADEVAMLCGS